MSKKWHSGPPPSLGWWPASSLKIGNIYRWWNGQYWSRPVESDYSKKEAATVAMDRSTYNKIVWQNRPDDWPARSRT